LDFGLWAWDERSVRVGLLPRSLLRAETRSLLPRLLLLEETRSLPLRFDRSAATEVATLLAVRLFLFGSFASRLKAAAGVA